MNTDLWDRTTERLGRVANSGREGIDDLPDVVGALDEDPDAGESGLRDGQGDADDPEDAEDVEENTTTPVTWTGSSTAVWGSGASAR